MKKNINKKSYTSAFALFILIIIAFAVLLPADIYAGSGEPSLVCNDSDEVTINYTVNQGYSWAYSSPHSAEGYEAYIAGNSGTTVANVSNLSITVNAPGALSFDYKTSTYPQGDGYVLYYKIGEPITQENYKTAANYDRYSSFRGNIDWTNEQFNIDSSNLDANGEATVYIAYLRNGTLSAAGYNNYVAIANVCFTSGEKTLTLNINGNEYGYISAGEDLLFEAEENTHVYDSGDTISLTAIADPEQENVRFYGWVDGEGNFLTTDETYSFMISVDTTLRAVFAPDGHYTVRHNGMFHTGVNSLVQAVNSATSGDTIVMLENYTLTQNMTVPEGVTLYIPFVDDFIASGNADGVTTSGSPYQASTKIATSGKTYRTLTINNGKTLTNNGTVIVGSVISYPSQNYQGHTSGWHGKIVNNGDIVVTNGGTLDCWGLIEGTGTVTANSGSAVYEPFIVYDFAGGWNTAGLYFEEQSPFKQYAMQNIQSEFIIHYEATLYGRCNLWATSKYNKVDIVFIGEEGMYQPAGGASLTRTYDGTKHIATNTDIGKMTYTFSGGMTLRHLSMPILGVGISTADVEFPIPYNWDMVLQSGDYQYDGRSKLMPGATLQVESDANLFVNATLLVLDGLIQSDMSGKFYPTTSTLQTAGFSGSGQMIVDGSLYITDSAIFGGIVQTTMDSNNPATISIDGGAQVNSKDVQDGAVGEYDANTSLFDLPARAYIYDQNKEAYNLKRLYSGRTYTSYDDTQWQIDSYSMTYAANTTWAEWDREGPVVDGKYHNWVTATVELDEARNGSWYSEGEIYHNIHVENQTIYNTADNSRTAVSNGELDLDDEIYEGGDITFTVDTTAIDGQGYVYQVSYAVGIEEAVIIIPDAAGIYTIEDIHDDITIYVTSCKLGDINLDNIVSNRDLLKLRKVLVLADTLDDFQRLAADLYPDGQITNRDLLQLRKVLVGL